MSHDAAPRPQTAANFQVDPSTIERLPQEFFDAMDDKPAATQTAANLEVDPSTIERLPQEFFDAMMADGPAKKPPARDKHGRRRPRRHHHRPAAAAAAHEASSSMFGLFDGLF